MKINLLPRFLRGHGPTLTLMVAAASATLLLASGCGAQDNQATTPPPVTATNAVTVFTCSMHPEVVSNAPGDCPKCGMHLVPKK